MSGTSHTSPIPSSSSSRSQPLVFSSSTVSQVPLPNQAEEPTDKDNELKAWLALNPSRPFPIARLPQTLILHIFSWLDLPDLASIGATGNGLLTNLSKDAVLHRARLRSVGAQCISPHLKRRPNILEVAKSGKMKGLNLESKIQRGCYLSSPNSIRLLENSHRVERLMIREKLNRLLSRRPTSRSSLLTLNLIDQELLFCSNLLAPVLRSLKRQQAKDLLARKLRYSDAELDQLSLSPAGHFRNLLIDDSDTQNITQSRSSSRSIRASS
ncbi:uncharacterized protein PGTG_17402 [Puccinia graminis f. sp. tritici CRL 75-36-700-3]|uniref:F-box domain-containing protein n=1 Tax=Puccinia graminis f. sp. tritici (strain CRL 75-36-700-3 / race SCCL) TaxID=418459 RepID=E3L6C2_PUCGT|nr:uncharacterized protein PGTG_17402 [Puccinia graminis f. sp. tritici CRL 75-36-700-3]EFP92097.1 hypothetical protein PGTG_17402 [Puccinia graminis f. sp. tritici CRL 75-36-700-3]